MNEDKISIIVPVYNIEKYLSACLDSIISQSYKNLEIIIIDDGSTDYSLKIAEKYAEKDDRIKVYSFPNKGLSEARNRGLNIATGNYITFVDSDDILLPDALKIMHNVLCLENADIVEGETIKGVYPKFKTNDSDLKYYCFEPVKAIKQILYQNTLLPSVWGKLFVAKLFNNIRFEKGLLYEDLDVIYKIILLSKKFVKLSAPVYFYRETPNSIVHTWNPKRLDVLKVTEKIENYISDKYPDLLPAAKDRRLSANFNMYALCTIHKDKENATKCWSIIKKYRKSSLINPKVRLKNKIGILLSYLGPYFFSKISNLYYSK